MPITAFIHRGVSRVYFMLGVANMAAPTRTEINAGVNLTPLLASVTGFALENQVREFAPVGAAFTEVRRGVDKVTAPCTLTLYDSITSTVRATWMQPGLYGVVILVPYGDVTGRRCETWPVSVATVADTWADGPALYRVVFGVRSAPTLNAVMPA